MNDNKSDVLNTSVSSSELYASYRTPEESFSESTSECDGDGSFAYSAGMSDEELLRQQLVVIREAEKLGLVVVEKGELDNIVMERERLRGGRRKLSKEVKKLTAELAEVRRQLKQLKKGQSGLHHVRTWESTDDETDDDFENMGEEFEVIYRREMCQREKEDDNKDDESQEDEPTGTLTIDTSSDHKDIPPQEERRFTIIPKNQKEIVEVVEHLKGLSLDLEYLLIENCQSDDPEESVSDKSQPQPEANVSRVNILHALTTAISELEIEVLESENLLKHGSEWSKRYRD